MILVHTYNILCISLLIIIHYMMHCMSGLQAQQVHNDGYGLIACEEGKTFFDNINLKKKQNSGEEGRLAKMWDGAGERVLLKDGNRSIDSTSLCIVLFIQPTPFLNELYNISELHVFTMTYVVCLYIA